MSLDHQGSRTTFHVLKHPNLHFSFPIMFVSTLKFLTRFPNMVALRAFATTTPEGIISSDMLDRHSKKKPNNVFHVYSTRVRWRQ